MKKISAFFIIFVLTLPLYSSEEQIAEEKLVIKELCLLYNSLIKPGKGEELDIRWWLRVPSSVTLSIYSRSGKLMKQWQETSAEGIHKKTWNCRDKGKSLEPGIYYIIITTELWQKKLMFAVIK